MASASREMGNVWPASRVTLKDMVAAPSPSLTDTTLVPRLTVKAPLLVVLVAGIADFLSLLQAVRNSERIRNRVVSTVRDTEFKALH